MMPEGTEKFDTAGVLQVWWSVPARSCRVVVYPPVFMPVFTGDDQAGLLTWIKQVTRLHDR
jgi:hypothetical protein